MSTPDITQRNNRVGRDQAGRDINHNTYLLGSSQLSPMGRLIEKFRREREDDMLFHDTIECLQHYTNPVHGEVFIGLEEKLRLAGREGFLQFAENTKERFTKKLVEYELSEAAQEIHAYLLVEVYTRFHQHVLPAIQQGLPVGEVNIIVQTLVIDPVRNLLEDNILRLYSDEINGMIYYLTGNCHIKWV